MKICFLSGLKEIVAQEELEIDFTGKLSSLLKELADRYGERLGAILFDSNPPEGRNPFLKILVEGEDVRQEDPLLAGDETIFLFLPIAGG